MSVEDKKIVIQHKPTESSQKEIEKYIKFFVIKSLHAIVSSRIGIHNKTRCKPSAKGQDWFNISLHDCEANIKLQGKIRDLFGKRVPTLWSPICLDIILRTGDGSFIILETWQLSTDGENKELKHKNHFSIYNRLGVLLKSVLSISRVLPAFNLAKKNEKDFALYFRVHSEVYSLHQYELNNSLSIGFVKTPIGTVNIKTMYRSKIWLSGSFHVHTYKIKDPESLLPLFTEKDTLNESSTFQSIDMFENELALAVSDTNQEWVNSTFLSNSKTPMKGETMSDFNNESSVASIGHEEGLRQVAAFADPFNGLSLDPLDLPKLPTTIPFQSLLQPSPTSISKLNDCDSIDGQGPAFIKETSATPPKVDNSRGSSNVQRISKDSDKVAQMPQHAEAVGFEDDFVLVELRPAFFSEDNSVGILYKQCQSPAPLEIFKSLEQEDEHSESVDFDDQLEKYRKELIEYQQFFGDTLNSSSK